VEEDMNQMEMTKGHNDALEEKVDDLVAEEIVVIDSLEIHDPYEY